CRSYEFNSDKTLRLLPADASQGVPVGLIVGALVASTGLTWVAISALPLPFVPTSGNGSSVNLESPAHILDSKKEDRFRMRATIFAPAQAPESPNFSPSSANNHAKPSLGAAPPVPSGAGDLQTR